LGIPATAPQRPLPWRSIFASKDVAAVTLSYFCYGYVAYIFFAWFFIYLNAVRGLNLSCPSRGVHLHSVSQDAPKATCLDLWLLVEHLCILKSSVSEFAVACSLMDKWRIR